MLIKRLLQKFGPKIRRMTKAGRDADDLGHMLVKMMAAQRAQAAGASAQATGADAPLAPTTTTEDEKKDGAGLSHDEELAIEQAPRLDTESHGGVTK